MSRVRRTTSSGGVRLLDDFGEAALPGAALARGRWPRAGPRACARRPRGRGAACSSLRRRSRASRCRAPPGRGGPVGEGRPGPRRARLSVIAGAGVRPRLQLADCSASACFSASTRSERSACFDHVGVDGERLARALCELGPAPRRVEVDRVDVEGSPLVAFTVARSRPMRSECTRTW